MTTQTLPPTGPFAVFKTIQFARGQIGVLRELARDVGSTFTLRTTFGPLVLTADPEGIKEIFTADPDTFEPFGTIPLEPLVGPNSMLLIHGARHKRERKLLMPPFHGERMRAYGQIMQSTAINAVSKLRPGERFVMQDMTQSITFDIILRAVFGVQDPDRIALYHRLNNELMSSIRPIFIFVSSSRNDMFPAWRRFTEHRRTVRELLQEQIEECRTRTGEHEDIMALMLAARDEEGQPMTDMELQDELLTMIAAGHETTAIGLAWAFFWLHKHPAILRRLLDEIDALGPAPSPEALAKLPYLGAVCDETLRRTPVLPMVPRRVVKPFRLRNWDIPPDTGVAAAVAAVHFDPEIYPDPDVFRPERFLERKFSPFEFVPFGGGHRRCLGAAFATYEMRIVLGTLLRSHCFTLESNIMPGLVRRNVTIAPRGGIPMHYAGERVRH
ncbi:MAG TPA: cytochrome P450 [Polyangium sp.]|nr:cytochrome P450 [Polyangium sp.]